MDKRGQISLFIIIGIILVLFVGILLVINYRGDERPVDVVNEIFDIDAIKSNVRFCIERSANQALYLSGLQGGYTDISSAHSHINIPPYDIAFGYDSTDVMISEDGMKEQISDYTKQEMEICLDDFHIFKMQGYEITDKPIDIDINFSEQGVKMIIEYPIIIIRGTSKHEFQPINVFFPVRIKGIFDASHQIIDKIETQGSPNILDITFFDSFNYDINVTPLTTGEVLYTLVDDNTNLYDRPFQFWFAAR